MIILDSFAEAGRRFTTCELELMGDMFSKLVTAITQINDFCLWSNVTAVVHEQERCFVVRFSYFEPTVAGFPISVQQ